MFPPIPIGATRSSTTADESGIFAIPKGIAGESGMTRPQRGAHRFMEESVPRTFVEEGHPTSGDPVIPIARPCERPGSDRAGRRRDGASSAARMGRSCPLTSTARDRD